MAELSSTVHVLAVSPNETDLKILSRILDHSAWLFESAPSIRDAQRTLIANQAHVVVCDKRLPDGDWKDLLELACSLPNPPQVIVASKDADDRLWAEVLKRGAWDVLVKPFHPQEVYQSVHLAWRHWQDGCRSRTRNVETAAGIGRSLAACG